ncbi:hypothetical protein JSQ81_14300 [Sporosarcina sp. Marseille-Q4063]|uniref:hypothetical protein n=1 Tax=Sporosarcina sp. Marseille-Q4063 TaxID=2810514 RepID=UPI001BAF96B9|nr:hypothetical protein [Sporosarcina sp. Marseille-Q4063]QUW20979.1 hypothetical protein JSQ81_14300 [Sporosarcina sp. Marseille-Q4063]
MKGRIFWLALFFIGLSWILNSYYAYSKRLDEPIFLDHYIELSVGEEISYLTLYYLTNINDNSHLSHVNFEGIDGYVAQDDFFFNDFGFYANEVATDLQTFTHYSLREIRIELVSYDLEELLKDNDELIIHEMKLFFDDGRDITVPIGEVVLRKPYEFENMLSQPWSGSNSDNLSIMAFSAGENLTIDSMRFKFDEVIKDHVFLKMDSMNTVSNQEQPDLLDSSWNGLHGIEIKDFKFPFDLEKDEGFKLYSQISPNFIGFLESSILITGSTESGKPFTSYSFINNHIPDLKQKDVDRIIQEKIKGGSR